jgi:hypothetical protein
MTPNKDMNSGDNTVFVARDAFGTSSELPKRYHLEQNSPNPFQHETKIGFTLPEAMEASIEVFDVNGRLVKSISQSFARGYNNIELERINFETAGVFYYRLQAGTYIATKRMIVLD